MGPLDAIARALREKCQEGEAWEQSDCDVCVASLAQLAQGDEDDRRMLLCLAIDVERGALDLSVLRDVVKRSADAGEPARARIGAGLSELLQDRADLCIHPPVTSGEGAGGESYVSVMQITKFMYHFRSEEGTGRLAASDEIRFLQKKARDRGSCETALTRPLRGYRRPITWLMRRDEFVAERDGARGNMPGFVERLVERLGLTWPHGVDVAVVAVFYEPASLDGVMLGRPNSFAEGWEDPGLFVSAPAPSDWGLTCARCEGQYPGVSERVHGPLAEIPSGAPLYAQLLGTVRLGQENRRLTLEEAERRWKTLEGRSDRRESLAEPDPSAPADPTIG